MSFDFPTTTVISGQTFDFGIQGDLPEGATFLGNVQLSWYTMVKYLHVSTGGALTFDQTSFYGAIKNPIEIDESAIFTVPPADEIYVVPVDQGAITNVPITAVLAYYSLAA